LKKPIFVIPSLCSGQALSEAKDLDSRRDSSPFAAVGGTPPFGGGGLRMTTFYDFFRSLKKFSILCFLSLGILTLVFGQGEFVYEDKGKRNPFIPLVTSEGRLLKLDKQDVISSGGLTIEGIIYDKFGRSFAIVNTEVVGIGDSVGNYQVLKIFENKVVFIKDGEPLEVELTKEEIR